MGEWSLLAADPPISPGGYIIGGIVVWAVVQVLSAVILARILQVKLAGLVGRVETLEEKADDCQLGLQTQDAERRQCELRASRTFATRGELMRVIGDQTAQSQEVGAKLDRFRETLSEKVGAVHARVDAVAADVATIKGRKDGP